MTADIDRVWNLMESIGTCMLVTRSGEGMRSRPMSAILHREEGAIWFLTDKRGLKDDELSQDNHVCLAFSDGGNEHVSLSGTASLTTDRDQIRQLWSPAAEAFWPDGPDTPGIVAIHVAPDQAEFWEGPSMVVTALKMAASIVTHQRPALGDNRKVAM